MVECYTCGTALNPTDFIGDYYVHICLDCNLKLNKLGLMSVYERIYSQYRSIAFSSGLGDKVEQILCPQCHHLHE